MNYTHDMPEYRERRERSSCPWNGAYYYSREIVENIIPRVNTSRAWVTVNHEGKCEDGAIVFVHNNKNPHLYNWLSSYRDLILVCGVPQTCGKVAHLGTAVYLPLSVDVAYVERFRRPKDRDTAYVGRLGKVWTQVMPRGLQRVGDMPRDELLAEMARCREVYAVGRCAIEARVLGCEVLPFDSRYPDPSIWEIVDNAEAADMLQGILDGVDS